MVAVKAKTHALAAAVLAAIAFCCGETFGETPMASDLTIDFHWRGPSVPPPHHYEYAITIRQSGAAEITMTAGYPGEGVPQWREAFTVGESDLKALRATLDAQRQAARSPDESRRSVGGATASVTITENGAATSLPSAPAGRPPMSLVVDAFEKIRPSDIWKSLMDKQEAYAAGYKKR